MNMAIGPLFEGVTIPDIHAFARARGWGAEPLIIDSFAGGGGASTGIEAALGRSPDIAINHSAAALALHAVNHPATLHLSENVYRIDPLDYIAGRHVGLAWFSPDCKHFSKAKGGKPVERNIRDLCWIIPGWVERIQKSGGKVDVVIMENVEEFRDYGPLIDTGKGLRPDPERKGESFRKWCRTLKRLGGKLEYRELRGCDYGAPTIRKRLFIIIRFDGERIVWPEPTHGKPADPAVIAGTKQPWPIVADCLDWSIPCPSIFDTVAEIKAAYGVNSVRPLADKSMARIARGLNRYVLQAVMPYLVSLSSGDRQCAPVLTYAQQGGAVRSIETPAHTITASGKDQNAVIAPTLIQTGYGERDGQAPRCLDVGKPLGTIVAGGVKHAAAVAFMAQHNNDNRRVGGVNPGRPVDEPASTITQTGSHQGVVAAYVSRQFGTGTGHRLDQPSNTIMGDGGGKSQLVAPYLQSYYAVGDGQRGDEPMRTATTKPRHGQVEAVLGVPPFTESQAARARQVADFLRSFGFWDDREFVTLEIDGNTFVIVDIGMRMLTPRELYNAQGFPRNYVIDRDAAGNVFSKEVQVSCVGNSVCPPLATALVGANCGHLVRRKVAA